MKIPWEGHIKAALIEIIIFVGLMSRFLPEYFFTSHDSIDSGVSFMWAFILFLAVRNSTLNIQEN